MQRFGLFAALLVAAVWQAPAGTLAMTDGFVGCSWSETCVPFDLGTLAQGTPIDLLPEGDYCYDATMNPAGTEVWIPGASGDGVVVIDRATNQIIRRLAVADYVISVAFSGDGSLALVTSRNSENVTIIDTATYSILSTLPAGVEMGNIALDPQSGNFYAVEWYGDMLYEIAPDGSAVLRTTVIPGSLWQLVVAPDGQAIYVTNRSTDQVHVIDPVTLGQVHAVGVGDDPWGLDVTGDSDQLVVTCEDSHEALFIDTATWAVTPLLLAGDADPRDVDILDEAGIAFVAGGQAAGASPVYVLDLLTHEIQATVEISGTNTNVVAVQPQFSAAGSRIPPARLSAGALSLACSPNPFGPATSVRFVLDGPTRVDLAVYDVSGRRLRTLRSGALPGGNHRIGWNGCDHAGDLVGAGLYFIRLQAGERCATLRSIRLD